MRGHKGVQERVLFNTDAGMLCAFAPAHQGA